MKKRIWMPLYVGDFLADTQHLGPTETGIYIRLIMHCWMHGSIPLDPRKLALISRCDPRLWHQYSNTIMPFFDVVNASTAQHKRVSTELQRCEEISNKRKGAALHMHKSKNANAVQMHTQSQSQANSLPLGRENLLGDAGAREAVVEQPLAPAPSKGGLTRQEWKAVLAYYKKSGSWSSHAGNEPPSPGCECPKDLLAEFGIAVA